MKCIDRFSSLRSNTMSVFVWYYIDILCEMLVNGKLKGKLHVSAEHYFIMYI